MEIDTMFVRFSFSTHPWEWHEYDYNDMIANGSVQFNILSASFPMLGLPLYWTGLHHDIAKICQNAYKVND